MRHAIQKHMRDFIAIIALSLFALAITGYILAHQRFYLPSWVPLLGTNFFELKGEFSTAQSVTPGQGQTVDIAGVPVGEIKKVELVKDRAVVTMEIKHKYAHLIKSDATMLLRPKTGLKDMIVELNPGTPGAPQVSDGYTVPVSNTRPDVNLDEILSQLDRDTRDYLRLLVAGGGEGLKNNGRNTAATLKRFAPLNRDLKTLNGQLAKRRVNLAHLIHNLQLLVTEVGGKDKQLAELVVSQNAVCIGGAIFKKNGQCRPPPAKNRLSARSLRRNSAKTHCVARKSTKNTTPATIARSHGFAPATGLAAWRSRKSNPNAGTISSSGNGGGMR